jgi:membrane associated rhomboid family serine protease
MKTDKFNKVMLCLIAVLLFLNLVSGLFSLRPATAEQAGPVNRFQISAWASTAGLYGGHHSGYYVLDTMTGKVVGEKEESHPVPAH